MIYRFPGQVLFDSERGTLQVADGTHSLGALSAAVLLMLVEQAPSVVSRAALIDEVWGGNHPVGERGLTREVYRLREILGDAAQSPVYIRTVPRKGYRLAFQPEPVVERKRTWGVPAFAVCALAAVIVVVWMTTLVAMRPESPEWGGDNPYFPVATSSEHEGQPALSEDGRLVAITAWNPGSRSLGIQVREMSVDKRPLFAIDGLGDERGPRFSPDSTRLLFLVNEAGECELRYVVLSEPERPIRVGPCDGDTHTNWDWKGANEIIQIRHPGRGSGWTLVLQDLQHDATRVLHHSTVPISKPRASPDGKRIGFLSCRTMECRELDLKVIDATSKIERWPAPTDWVPGFDWWDNDSAIIAVHFFGRDAGILGFLSREQFRPIDSSPAAMAVNVDVATGSQAVIVQAVGLDTDIELRSLDGELLRRFQSLGTAQTFPALSSNGEMLAFISAGQGGDEVQVAGLQTDGGIEVKRSRPGERLRGLEWSGSQRLNVRSAVGNSQQLSVFDVRHAHWMDLEVDIAAGTAFMADDGVTVIYMCGDDTRPEAVCTFDLRDGATDEVVSGVVALRPANGGFAYQDATGVVWRRVGDDLRRLAELNPDEREWRVLGDAVVHVTVEGDGTLCLHRDGPDGSRHLVSRLQAMDPRVPPRPRFDISAGLIAIEVPAGRWSDIYGLNINAD